LLMLSKSNPRWMSPISVLNSSKLCLQTLMLHHSIEPEKVFQSIKEILKSKGKAIIVDLCKHSFECTVTTASTPQYFAEFSDK